MGGCGIFEGARSNLVAVGDSALLNNGTKVLRFLFMQLQYRIRFKRFIQIH